jgi:protein-S-isoprenylcysteine O-methyltransferase Ste14
MITLWLVSWVELLVCWFAWWYPFIFRAPHVQKRPSITLAGPTRVGLLLEGLAIFMAFLFHIPGDRNPGMPRVLLSMAIGPLAPVLAWAAVTHLGRQFRINAGLYEDHQLVQSGPYSLVRHPIYASLLAILVATLLLLTPWEWIAVSLLFFIAGTEIRVRTEDQLLASRFGPAFDQYRRKVPAYIPWIR